ncbi:slit homolog 3 protein-like [Strongylocentrotus purpuratus]|uniref:Ig-like domain-containing protein n=1 Tax=Strongylocentrotus purpuratus TaxID=7668 RepID=A0A7M7NKR0_STRPU|nr:slit homolog 3 protein-like [Strongylocentrotus purpuratus]XP_030837043.1 slit homolog 3 protein-like [Strongylocentrotus purpuratus]
MISLELRMAGNINKYHPMGCLVGLFVALLVCPYVCTACTSCPQNCTCVPMTLPERCTCPEYGIIPVHILQYIVHLELNYSQPVVLRAAAAIQKFQQLKHLKISGMQSVKSGGFKGLETLHKLVLYDNFMRVLETYMFSSLHNLTNLTLEGTAKNKIHALENGTFSGLKNLKYLSLKGNVITEIFKESFLDLDHLYVLDLSSNRLTQIKADTFIHAPLLTKINMSKNLITEIHRYAFNGLKSLVTLDLEGNRIKGMPQPVFSPGSLRGSDVQHKNIHLDNNLLRCDCHLNWISSWLDRGKICEGRCRTPSKLFNLTLEHVYKDGLPQCQPNNTIWSVEQGQQLKLTCPFAGASWVTPDGRSLQEHGDCEDAFCLTNSDSLVVWKTTPELSGNYTCRSSDGTQAFVYPVHVKALTVAMIAGIVAGGFVLMVIIIVAGCKLRKNDNIRLNSTSGNPPRGNSHQGNPSAEHDTCVDGDDRDRLLQEVMDRVSSAKLARAVKYESIIFQKDSLSDIKNINIFNSKST